MNSVNPVILISSLIIGALLLFSLVKKEKPEGLKLFLFLGIVVPIVFTTIYLAAATVIKNQSSITKGPVHWHADYEIFVCGENQKTSQNVKGVTKARAHEEQSGELIDLKDPKGISNRIGTSDFHEHGDNRIHVEGVVTNLEDVSLQKFFEVVGGHMTTSLLRMPTNKGELIVQNGMTCPSGQNGILQVFVYKTKNNVVTQEKLTDFPNYVISPHSTVPPGDCLIIEFEPEKDKTEKICKFYEIAIEKGELKYAQ